MTPLVVICIVVAIIFAWILGWICGIATAFLFGRYAASKEVEKETLPPDLVDALAALLAEKVEKQ